MLLNSHRYLSLSTLFVILATVVVMFSIIQFGIYRVQILFPISIIICFFIAFKKFKIFFKLNETIIFFIFSLFYVVLSVVSSISQLSFYPIASYVVFFIASTVMIALGIYSYTKANTFLLLIVGVSLVIYLFSLKKGFYIYRYSGLFDNPNGLGRFASGMSVLLVMFLFAKWKEIKIFYKVLLVATLLISVVMTLASNSRISLGLILLIPLALFLLHLLYHFYKLKVKKKNIKRIFIFFGILLLLAYIGNNLGLFDNIVAKFLITTEKHDVSQGRFERWQDVLENVSLFGYGHAFYEIFNTKEVHNNYLSQVVITGLIPSFFFFLSIIICAIASLRAWFKYNNINAMVSSSMFSFYLMYGIAETAAAIFVIWIGFYYYGVSLGEKISHYKVMWYKVCTRDLYGRN